MVLAFLPTSEAALESMPGMSLGIASVSQGVYDPTQMLLDITQGARVADSAYPYSPPPPLTPAPAGTAARIEGWRRVRARALAAPQLLVPGLLASSIPGGVAYVGIAGQSHRDAIAAADRHGDVAAFSIGSAASLPTRLTRLRERWRLIMADLATGATGLRQLRDLARSRPPGELLLVAERAGRGTGNELLWMGATGQGRASSSGGTNAAPHQEELTSQTTRQRGLIASIDIPPTVLHHLHLPVPAQMRGTPIEARSPLDGAGLRALVSRLRVIGTR
ncbi:MAG TPA: hypothetical protein VL972_03795, partial [Solirubrobacteraceae bacterium]|nr:hypothetical protein [Solirubrobacteraceae bacterium]